MSLFLRFLTTDLFSFHSTSLCGRSHTLLWRHVPPLYTHIQNLYFKLECNPEILSQGPVAQFTYSYGYSRGSLYGLNMSPKPLVWFGVVAFGKYLEFSKWMCGLLSFALKLQHLGNRQSLNPKHSCPFSCHLRTVVTKFWWHTQTYDC